MNVFMSIMKIFFFSMFIMHKFNKHCDLPFKYSQFIKFTLNIPMKQAYNVVILQTMPIFVFIQQLASNYARHIGFIYHTFG